MLRSEGLQEPPKFWREGGVDLHGFAGLGVGEGEVSGVEEVSVESEG